MIENKKDKKRRTNRETARRNRIKVLQHYSSQIPFCACCNENEIKFLCLDHINNDGYRHRKNGKRAAGTELYRLVMKNKFPLDFQVLCHNCNSAKGYYGECPHKASRRE